jgi:hypothetical protein
MNLKNKAIFLAVFFFAVITWNTGAQEQAGIDEQPGTDAQLETNEQPGTDEQTDEPVYILNFQPIPGLNVLGHNFEKTADIFLIGTIVGYGYRLKGFGTASLGLINSGRVQGLQFSGFFNFANAGMDGFQTASIFNVAKGVTRGAQAAGFYNYASGPFTGLQVSGGMNNIKGDMWGLQLGPINRRGKGDGVGVQVGLLNFSESGNVIPIGFVNKVKGGMQHFWVFTDDMLFMNAGYRSGSRIFYSHSNIGIGGGLLPGREGDKLVVNRGGFGLEFPIRKFFIDIDLSRGNIFNVDKVKDLWGFLFGNNTAIYQLRLIGGYKMYERLGVFAGISFDYLYQSKNGDPSPQDFFGAVRGKSNDKNTLKMGFFGGMQF